MLSEPSNCKSLATLDKTQSLIGDFVGYQACLDFGYLSRAWFDQRAVLVVGPGAVGKIARMYPQFPAVVRKMEGSKIMTTSAQALIRHLEWQLRQDFGMPLRQASAAIGTPSQFDVSEVEYWLCERRQEMHDRRREPSCAPQWYVDSWSHCDVLKNAFAVLGGQFLS